MNTAARKTLPILGQVHPCEKKKKKNVKIFFVINKIPSLALIINIILMFINKNQSH